MRTIFILLGFISFSGFGFGQENISASDAQTEKTIKEVTYLCERNIKMPVVFVGQGTAQPYAIVKIEGKLIVLKDEPNVVSALYVALNEQLSYRLHINENKATLGFMEADHEATEELVLKACTIE